MIPQIIAVVNTLIFVSLGLLHIYWAFGGTWKSKSVIPNSPTGEALFAPGKAATIIVGLGLLIIALYFVLKINLLGSGVLPAWIMEYGGWLIAAIFLLRAIGEFKYVGFFKSIKNTTFAENDTKYYSPLCLYLSISTLFIHILI